jgi:EAL domain-containing protein (putative c-di-GMP-specific phosphodiesterase class I)
MDDPTRALILLTRLHNMGIQLEIDDFGTGYSSLAYLKRLPVDGLKVDRSFVQHLEEDENDAVIVASTIGLAHSLGLHVVAEGVETLQVMERLANLACDVAQGYYLSRPVAAPELVQWHTTWTAQHAVRD